MGGVPGEGSRTEWGLRLVGTIQQALCSSCSSVGHAWSCRSCADILRYADKDAKMLRCADIQICSAAFRPGADHQCRPCEPIMQTMYRPTMQTSIWIWHEWMNPFALNKLENVKLKINTLTTHHTEPHNLIKTRSKDNGNRSSLEECPNLAWFQKKCSMNMPPVLTGHPHRNLLYPATKKNIPKPMMKN